MKAIITWHCEAALGANEAAQRFFYFSSLKRNLEIMIMLRFIINEYMNTSRS